MVSSHDPAIMKFLLSFLLGLSLVFIFSSEVSAAFSFNVDSISSTEITSKDQEIQVSISINELPSESYFRVAFQKSNGDPYLGYMKDNNGNYVKIGALNDPCSVYYFVSDRATTALTLTLKG